MASKSKALLLLLSVFLLSATLALSTHRREDPQERLEECKQECRQQTHYDPGMRRRCERRCEERTREEEREEGRGRGEERERERDANPHRRDPEQQLKECTQQCHQRRQGEEKQRQCQRRCEEEYRERRERHEGNCHHEGEEEERTEKNPYFFDRQSFRHRVRTEHGSVRILKRFSEKSELLRGIDKFRLGILEADPHAFFIPHHLDADAVFFVVKGRGTITLMCGENKRESHDLRRGDILRVQAGSVLYLTNKESNEKLIIAKLLRPVANPGQVESFSAAGGEESFYQSFSNEVLEAAFNAPSDRLRRVFGQQRKGAVVRASEEQIRAIGRHTSEGGPWPFGQSQRPFNLFHKRATHSSRRGELYEADASDYQPLRDLDIQVSFANISAGSMIAPFYNSRATKIAVVTEGRGYVEMVCPHLARRSQERHRRGGEETEEEREREQEGQRYQRVRAPVSPGTVFVMPPGHPTVTVASPDQNLQAVCFEICAENNKRIFLAGRNNVLNQMEREAKELSFGVPAREVDEVFRAQKEEVFVAGPQERREGREGRQPLSESVLDILAF